LSTSCPLLRSLHRLILSVVDVLPAAPLAASLVSFPRRRLARCSAPCIARLFLVHTSASPPRRSRNPSFLSVVEVFPAVPLAVSLVSFTRRQLGMLRAPATPPHRCQK
jgi:hypothetical protein